LCEEIKNVPTSNRSAEFQEIAPQKLKTWALHAAAAVLHAAAMSSLCLLACLLLLLLLLLLPLPPVRKMRFQ
jgi:hypothetical protein